MTNRMIVLMERCKLMEDGIIGGTGRFVEIETDEGTKTLEEPEEIFTVKEWNKRGFLIKTGETHIAEFYIWKRDNGKGKKANAENPEDSEDSEESEVRSKSNGRKRQRRNNGYFWGKACFFKASQVTPIPAKEA